MTADDENPYLKHQRLPLFGHRIELSIELVLFFGRETHLFDHAGVGNDVHVQQLLEGQRRRIERLCQRQNGNKDKTRQVGREKKNQHTCWPR